MPNLNSLTSVLPLNSESFSSKAIQYGFMNPIETVSSVTGTDLDQVQVPPSLLHTANSRKNERIKDCACDTAAVNKQSNHKHNHHHWHHNTYDHHNHHHNHKADRDTDQNADCRVEK